jgi:hypothetical protein
MLAGVPLGNGLSGSIQQSWPMNTEAGATSLEVPMEEIYGYTTRPSRKYFRGN